MKNILSPKFLGGFIFAAVLSLLLVDLTGCTTVNTVATTPLVSTNAAGIAVTNLVTTTNTTRVLDLAAVTNTIVLVGPLAVQEAISQDPESKQYFTDAATAITAFVGGANYSPAALDAALAQIPGNAFQNAQTLAAINSLVGSYEGNYAQIVAQKLPYSTYAVPILNAMARAIVQGIAQSQ